MCSLPCAVQAQGQAVLSEEESSAQPEHHVATEPPRQDFPSQAALDGDGAQEGQSQGHEKGTVDLK